MTTRKVTYPKRTPLIQWLYRSIGRYCAGKFEKRTKNAPAVNAAALREIVELNQDTDFGRTHNFSALLKADDLAAAWRAALPLSDFSAYEPYIERIKLGEENVLTADPVDMLAGSAGTTRVGKRLPKTKRARRKLTFFTTLIFPGVLAMRVPGAKKTGHGVNLMSTYQPRPESGDSVAVMTSNNAGIRQMQKVIPYLWCSPGEVFDVPDQPTAHYLHALFALRDPNTRYAWAIFASQISWWFEIMRERQDELLHDIETGTLTANLELDASQRASVEAKLFADPGRANFLRDEFARGLNGIVPRIWPKFTYVAAIALASYWGGMLGSSNIGPNIAAGDTSRATVGLPPSQDCGAAGVSWSFLLDRAIEFRNQDSAASTASLWNCIGDHRAGTDVVAIRHVSGQTTGEMVLGDSQVLLRPHHFYLQTNGTTGTMTRWGSAAQAAPDALEAPALAPMTFHRYTPRIYFIRNFSITPGDNIPTLCRKELCPTDYAANGNPELASCGLAGGVSGAAGYYSECIAEGIEDLQIVWGLDTDQDFVVDRYTSTPTDPELMMARSAQIHLLVRSRNGNPQHTDSKTYTLADKSAFTPATVNDPNGTPPDQQTRHFYRRVYSTTVQLRNMGIQEGSGIN